MRARLRPEVLIGGLFLVGVVGLMVRVLVVGISVGSNDMLTWRMFARNTSENGLGWMYDNILVFNHPPLMGLFASLVHRLSMLHEALRFDWLFKAPMVLADLLSASLLWRTWRRQSAVLGAVVFALFCWNPVSILISAYHGNTDALCASLMLVAAVLMDSNAPFWAGLALAAGINVKLVPVLLIVPLLACAGSRKAALRCSAGLSLGVLPFLPFLIWHWDGFYAHVLQYRSNARVWGVSYLAHQLRQVPGLMSLGRWISEFWAFAGTPFVFLVPIVLGALRFSGRLAWSARELLATSMLAFVVLAPGWGVQYAVYPVPLLFAVYHRGAVVYTLAAGVYAAWVYSTFWTGTVPIYSAFAPGVDRVAQAVGVGAWLAAAGVGRRLLFQRSAPPELAPPASDRLGAPVDSAEQSLARAPARERAPAAASPADANG